MKKSDNLQKIKTTVLPFARRYDLSFVGLFGSMARGDFTEKSDMDFLVEFCGPVTLPDVIGLEKEMSKKFKRKVDLVTEKALNPRIRKFVFKDLKVIYEKK